MLYFSLYCGAVATPPLKKQRKEEKEMKMKKFITAALTAVMAVSVLAGCSKSSSSEKKTVKVVDIDLTDEEYAFGVDKDQTDLLDQVNAFIKEIKENGKFDEICNNYFGDGTPVAITSAAYDENKDQLVVATNAAFEPFEYTKGDTYLGIDMEIMRLFSEKIGKELVIQNMDFDAVCLSVGQHKCDIAAAGLTIKEERKEYVTFSDAYYKASQKIVVLSSNTEFDDCKTAADVETILKSKNEKTTIGVQNGTTGQFYSEGDEDWGFEGFPVKTAGYKNGALAIQDLINGNVTYVIIDAAPAACITASINKMQ